MALLNASSNVLGFVGKKGKALYDALDELDEQQPIRKAGMMNIFAKTAATGFANGRTVLSYIQELRELRGDRFYAVVSKELREETKNSIDQGLFHKADESQHRPPDGFTSAKSFKTSDRYGNLQLTLLCQRR